MKAKHAFCLGLTLLAGLTSVAAHATPTWQPFTETFAAQPTDPNWQYTGTWEKPLADVFDSGLMKVQTANGKSCRATYLVALPENVDIIVTGKNEVVQGELGKEPTLYTHARNYIGVYQPRPDGDEEDDPTLQLKQGTSLVSLAYDKDTHYAIDLANRIGYTSFQVRIRRVGQTVWLYSWLPTTSTWQTLATHTLKWADAPLYFEVASLDGSRSSAASANIDSIVMIPEPASMALLMSFGLGTLTLIRRRGF